MKKHLIFALVLFTALPCMAQVASIKSKHHDNPRGNASLSIVAPKHQTFWLYIDDVLQNDQPVHSICIRNMGEDRYYIRTELNNPQQNCVGQFVDLKHSQSISITQSGKHYGLNPTQDQILPDLTLDLITEPSSTDGNSHSNIPIPPMSSCMSSQDYENAYRLISKESFDSSKLAIAKQIVSANPMNAGQILGICKLLSFESNKLDFAKYAYPYCVEPNKYYLLNETFTYESSKRELDEFIKGR